MRIYSPEAHIAHLVQNNRVIAQSTLLIDENIDHNYFCDYVDNLCPSNELSGEAFDTIAKIKEDRDIMPLSSILVSSVINLNDDCFTSEELILALNTPCFKPINWQHCGNEIRGNENIGVMVNTSLLSGDLNSLEIISDTAGVDLDISGNIHIRQDGLIWSAYFPTYAKNIRDGIKDENLFVSMECFFQDFGYAIFKETNQISLLDRTEKNSSLSENLKCFGGTGLVSIESNKHRIARWLKGICFSGQGIVSSPANIKNDRPLSIILSLKHNKKKKRPMGSYTVNSNNLLKSVDCVYEFNDKLVLTKGNIMIDKSSATELMEKQLRDAIESRDELAKRLSEIEGSATQAKLQGLTDEFNGVKSDLNEANKLNETFKTQLKEFESIKEELAKVKSENSKLNDDLEEIRSLEVARERLDELQAILNNKEIEVKLPYDLDKLSSMSDETFAEIKQTLQLMAGVSSNPKLTDQGVSNQQKLTDQGVSSKSKLTEAGKKTDIEDEADLALNDALVEDSADLIVSDSDNTKSYGEVAGHLLREMVFNRKKK